MTGPSDTLPDRAPDTQPAPGARARWPLALSLLAGAVAAPLGYGAGLRISGPGMGWLMAANSAVFCALMAGAAIDRLRRLAARRQAGRDGQR